MDKVSYVEYLANPSYLKFPFRGIIGWLMARGGSSNVKEPLLVSADGYTLRDVNGINLIPKETE